ncbi:MAG: hypothetical protein WD273_03955 [Trueperaceae bacterium]
MQRWAITLDGKVRRRLTQEQLELGTELLAEDGESLLVFRDRFVCLRVASAAGTYLLPYEEPRQTAAI